VFSLVMPISRRVIEPCEDDVEPDVVLPGPVLLLWRFGDRLSKRSGEASLSASASSLSTISMLIDRSILAWGSKDGELVIQKKGDSNNGHVQCFYQNYQFGPVQWVSIYCGSRARLLLLKRTVSFLCNNNSKFQYEEKARYLSYVIRDKGLILGLIIKGNITETSLACMTLVLSRGDDKRASGGRIISLIPIKNNNNTSKKKNLKARLPQR